MIRVAFLTPSLHTGGAERFILTLARHFQHCEARAVIQLPMRVEDNDGRAMPVLRHFSDPAMVDYMSRVMRVERAKVYGEDLPAMVANGCRDADVLIAWGISDLSTYTRNIRPPTIEVSHASGEWSEQTKITADSWKGAQHLVAVSRAAKTAFPEEVRDQVTVLYNGIDAEHVMPRYGRRSQRAAWGIDDDTNIALFLGRFAAVKRPGLFVHAVAELPDNWKGVMIGHGPDEAATRHLAYNVCGDKIIFPGLVSHAGDAFAAADVFVMTSEAEGHPLTLTESWIAGVPAVCTPFAFLTEAEERLGLAPCLTTMESPQEIATKIIEAIDDPHVETRRQRACEQFSASAMAGRWEAFLYGFVQSCDRLCLSGKQA